MNIGELTSPRTDTKWLQHNVNGTHRIIRPIQCEVYRC